MPRLTWSRLTITPIALAALTLVSCFRDASDCTTCPPVDSGRILVGVPRDGLVDSVHVSVDGGSRVTVRRTQTRALENLSRGTHDVTITRWFFIDEIVSSRTTVLEISLDRGETRTISFHNDLPLVTWGPVPDWGPAPFAGRIRSHSGWARA